MVALITPTSLRMPAGQPPTSPAVAPSTPSLRLIRGGLDTPERDHSMLFVVVALLAVVGAVLGLRMVQGQPPAASFEARAAGAATASAGVAEAVHVVAEGDTLWAIAQDLAPGRDPRPVVDALAARNGGTALRAGDLLVIPSELMPDPATSGLASGVVDPG